MHFILRFHLDRHVIVIQEEICPAQKRQPASQCINEGADTSQHDRCFPQHIEFRIKAQNEPREQHAHREQRPRLEAAARRKFTEAEDVDCIYHREGYQHAEGYIQDQTAKWFIHLIISPSSGSSGSSSGRRPTVLLVRMRTVVSPARNMTEVSHMVSKPR